MTTNIEQTIKAWICTEALSRMAPEKLESATSLFESGLLDSMCKVKLINYLEKTYSIEVEMHEAMGDTFETIASISKLIAYKMSSKEAS